MSSQYFDQAIGGALAVFLESIVRSTPLIRLFHLTAFIPADLLDVRAANDTLQFVSFCGDASLDQRGGSWETRSLADFLANASGSRLEGQALEGCILTADGLISV